SASAAPATTPRSIAISWRGAAEAEAPSNPCYRAGMDPFAIKLIGFAAATCTTIAYAPQAIKVWKTRSARDISLGIFLIMVLGLTLWLIYGLLSGDAPLVAANAITILLAGGILFMKLKYG
ncbi:SemiSWEET transporter, partial [Xanthomonas citri pv. citri]